MPFDVDPANPADDSLVSQFPPNERMSRSEIEDWMDWEHGASSGRHKIPRGTTTARDNISDWEQGSLWINTSFSPSRLQVQENASAPFSWTDVGPIPDTPEFSSGTVMIFAQANPPTGWTQTADNDRVLRVVSGNGGGTGGSWTISGLNVLGHALTVAEMPSHDHVVDLDSQGMTSNNDVGGGRITSGGDNAESINNFNTESRGGGAAHDHPISHNGSWRPAHKDVIIASKD